MGPEPTAGRLSSPRPPGPSSSCPAGSQTRQERARATPAGLGLGAAAPFRNAPQCERDFLGLEPVSQ